jgi:cell wall-associated NlpC family hydrolase
MPRRGLSSGMTGWRMAAIALVTVAAALGGCSSMRPSPVFTSRETPPAANLPTVAREDLLNEISMYHGVAYKPGGDSFDGLDCSGLVQAVFGPLGVSLPRTVLDLYESGVPVPRQEVMTGDLVFFGGRTPDHVGIAVSDREMVHASVTRGVVLEDIVAFAKSSRLSGVRRVVALR